MRGAPCLLLALAFSLAGCGGGADDGARTPATAVTAPDTPPGTVREWGGVPFVWCPPGTVQLGTPQALLDRTAWLAATPEWFADEVPPRAYTNERGFWLSQTEVTRDQYYAVVGFYPESRVPQYFSGDYPASEWTRPKIEVFLEKLAAAAEGVFRLPTGDEWAYACRAGAETLFPWGNDVEALPQYAWTRANRPGFIHPVAARQPNAWGLHDMLGNLWEVTLPPGATALPVDHWPIRGGSVNQHAPRTRPAFLAEVSTAALNSRFIGLRILREP